MVRLMGYLLHTSVPTINSAPVHGGSVLQFGAIGCPRQNTTPSREIVQDAMIYARSTAHEVTRNEGVFSKT
jgi:hypothetical protein